MYNTVVTNNYVLSLLAKANVPAHNIKHTNNVKFETKKTNLNNILNVISIYEVAAKLFEASPVLIMKDINEMPPIIINNIIPK